MLLTPHLLAGAAIASKISNPFLALPLALLSHYCLDSLPHEEYTIENIKQKRWNKSFFDFSKVFLDILLGILLIAFFSEKSPTILAAAFLTLVPDGITLVHEILPSNKALDLHQKLHQTVNCLFEFKNKKIAKFLGILSQITVMSTAVFLIK